MGSDGLTYREAGVDRAEIARALGAVADRVRGTFTPQVLGDLGQFSGLFHLRRYRDPVLVSTIDGVGTKGLLLREAGRLAVAGRDAIVHGVNDVAVLGGTPLFALDYIAAGRLEPAEVTALLEGMAAACREEGVALVGGETAQMPGVYTAQGLDVAACVVGVVERDEVADGAKIKPGHLLVGLAADGLHTNGFSLIREVMARRRWALDTVPEGLGVSLRDALLVPHRSYRKPLLALARSQLLRGAAHITGGGIAANLVRVLPDGCRAVVDTLTWTVPTLFAVLARAGGIETGEMWGTFNMGVGAIAVVPRERGRLAVDICRANGAEAWIIGEVVAGERGVEIR
ncbi:MAG: phosphoribosylformylglycinamidine cyclo-ligase [Armatimonadota bacterium]|nr:phosphoribosylformylglycinamidine cyclo-ligase [Armatimonadota bacterium]MDR7452481.1 phosphoribosylformylglycinamidine cyclo-ligase [Armatimonadota bacterium]MDR7467333.1 phosphoribosylformylglycinamidine cyclo-ligase [Armatimonadota bacterium]MDR7494104.1 phosphoribosylformylglycinamidine cyclo-ligase [Armatimonadota bacterium]MDR7498929.1 phosphoribosylformylglycinamidine cyclo-ligase [Armatimonadota bacterium]